MDMNQTLRTSALRSFPGLRSRALSVQLLLVSLGLAGAAGGQTAAVGLSTVRGQLFGNENISNVFVPEADDRFGTAVAVGDFDGNGVDDLATGIPLDDGSVGSGCTNCGGVVVRYAAGGRGLLPGLAPTFLTQLNGTPDPDGADLGDRFGAALAAGDFDGDGIDDLAVGVPGNSIGFEGEGGVEIHRGQTTGIQVVADLFLVQGVDGMPNFRGSNDFFGSALAAGDFNGDAYDDLAIGAFGDFAGVTAGSVTVVQGSPDGLRPAESFLMCQACQGLPDVRENGDEFGFSVAAADFDGDGFGDLAIGSPGEDGVGATLIVFGSPFSLLFADHRWWGQFDLGGLPELEDRFGETLAAGDFDGDGRADLAMGAPLEDVLVVTRGTVADAGAINVIYGHPDGFDLARTQYWDQGFGNFASLDSETGDRFASALAAGDFDGDGRDDLAIGHYSEDSASGVDSGAVTAVMGAASVGISAARRRTILIGQEGFPGAAPQDGRHFGFALATGDFDDDGVGDLAAGAPREDVGDIVNVGVEMVLYGSLFADGFDSENAAFWTSAVP